ncbi:MAG: glyoxalase [Thermoleophilia bacterium]|nr:glyoxalase [Thermoleophilia bacterium]MDH4346576.1 glyoxalase [Thermoleophilia bacterium]MDH5333061.1 glyoxalase [Thermoleophilia bacterium]
MVLGLDHVQVAAPPGCEADARRFYSGLLGLTELEQPPRLASRGGCWFRLGAHELHVGVADSFSPATKAHPGIRVASTTALRALAERLEAAGVAVEWADPAEIAGRSRCHVHDPWGNRLELLADDVTR